MSERFFVEAPIGDSATCELAEGEAHHLAKVMRLPVGAEVLVFDGCGCEFTARVASIAKAKVGLEILERRAIDREAPVEVTLAVALPKGDRQKFLVEKLVELGVARFIPLVTKRGVAEAGEGALERLHRQVIEASKQCERNCLMQILPPMNMAKLVEQMQAVPWRFVAHPRREVFQPPRSSMGDSIVAAIGPEGGFTDEEVGLAQEAGWGVVSLGPRIMRVETAALALAAILTQARYVSSE